MQKVSHLCALCLFVLPAACSQHVPICPLSAEWYAAETDMQNFYHAAALTGHRDDVLRQAEQSTNRASRNWARNRRRTLAQLDAAAKLLGCMSREQKEALALAYVQEYDEWLLSQGMQAGDSDFIADNIARLHDMQLYQNLSNPNNVLHRAAATLPPEQYEILATRGGQEMMEGYGGYMLVRYVQQNPDMDRNTRTKAANIASLWYHLSDGCNGYRSRWLSKQAGYCPPEPE